MVYEVNIAVDKDTAAEFEAWLRPHAQELLDLPDCHFTGAEIFTVDEDGDGAQTRKNLCVHYRLRDREGLRAYLDVHAPRLRGDGARFAGKMSITRRVYQSLHASSPAVAVAAASPATRRTVTFVTGNAKKLEEVVAILSAGGAALPCDVTNAKLDLPELQGEPEEVAAEKAKLAAQEIGGPAMTEDTSLCFNALGGLPGVYIKWFLEKLGHDGLNKMLAAHEDKSAYAQCVFAYCAGPGAKPVTFVGRTAGKIVGARGPLDFGWDPVFEPDESGGKTFAEMAKPDKNAISHRGRALAKVRDFLLAHG